MSYVGAVTMVLAFLLAFRLLGVGARARKIFGLVAEAMTTLRSEDLDDLGKERALQALSLRLLGAFGRIMLLAGLALLGPLGLVAGLDALGLLSLEDTLQVSMSAPFLLASSVVIVLCLLLSKAVGR